MSGFEQPNYTQTPNAFFDKVMLEIDTMSELKVTLCVIRQTFGYHKEEDQLSLSRIMELTGLRRDGVIDGLKRAMKRGTVTRRKVGQTYIYRAKLVGKPDQLEEPTSRQTGPEVVGKPDQQLVGKPDPQKKVSKEKKENPTNVGASSPPKATPNARKPIEKNPIKYLVDLLRASKERGLKPPPLPPRQRSEYGQFIRQALIDGEPVDLVDNALHWLIAKASGEINDEKKAWAFFGTALDHAREGWKPKGHARPFDERHLRLVEENERILQDLLKDTAYAG